jgi:hypothetical protein
LLDHELENCGAQGRLERWLEPIENMVARDGYPQHAGLAEPATPYEMIAEFSEYQLAESSSEERVRGLLKTGRAAKSP